MTLVKRFESKASGAFKISTDEIISILEKNNSILHPIILTRPPEPNCIYLCAYSEHGDYKCDSYINWEASHKHYKSNDFLVKRTYYKTRKSGSNNYFRKTIYSIPEHFRNVLIVYYGDPESGDANRPHGNAITRTSIYSRTAPVIFDRVKALANPNISLSSKTISRVILKDANVLASGISHHFEDENSDPVFINKILQIRNSSQIHNTKYNQKHKVQINQDELYSLHVLAKTVFEDSVLFVLTVPFTIILFTDSAAITLANSLMKLKDQPNLLSYDTTFNRAEGYYLSTLVMKHPGLIHLKTKKDNPHFPLFFLIHDSKCTDVHEFAFQQILKFVSIPHYVPIITDRESSIVAALWKVGLKPNHLFCRNHIITDVNFWLKSKLNL